MIIAFIVLSDPNDLLASSLLSTMYRFGGLFSMRTVCEILFISAITD